MGVSVVLFLTIVVYGSILGLGARWRQNQERRELEDLDGERNEIHDARSTSGHWTAGARGG